MAGIGFEAGGDASDRDEGFVNARAVELTAAADRERLIQALPVFRGIVAAQPEKG